MDRDTFEKELLKYKTVRLADQYTPKVKSNPLVIKSSPRPVPTEQSKKKVSLESDAKFWDLVEKLSSELLNADEVTKFMENMKKVYTDFPELVNLEDLNAAVSLVKAH